jgi:hypothetical protein
MTCNKKNNYPLAFFFSVISFEILIVLLHFAKQPSTTQSILIYSPHRLFTIILLFLLFSGFAWASIQVAWGTPSAQQFQSFVSQKKRQLFLDLSAYSIGVISWILYFTPVDWFGKLQNYILITKPLIALGIIISVQTLLYLALKKHSKKNLFQFFRKDNKPFLISVILIFSCFLILWVFIDISGMGIVPSGADWNEAGVPILGWQIFIGFSVGLLLLSIEKALKRKKLLSRKFDVVIFILIWIVGGYLWAKTPAPNGYLNPGPYPPTNETYPFADAARFDLMSQYALIGQGLNNSKAYNRPVYPAFLVYLHMLSGQNYANNMGLQAALLAVFPALLYLTAKLLSNRSTGAALATLIILRGINGIAATNLINLANQKQMLTGFPTALLAGLILLGTLAWLRQPNKLHLMVLLGGIFGLGIYLRQTVLGFFPVMVLLPFFIPKLKKQRPFFTLALFVLGIIAFGIPYEVKNYVEHPNYRYPAVIRKIFTIAETRYIPKEEIPGGRERSVSGDDRSFWGNQKTIPEKISGFEAVGNHFMRNIITSTLILPHSFSIDSLRNTIKAENSFWRASWNGQLNIEQSFFLILNLALISIGVISASYRFPLGGWLPLLFFLGYNLANALAKSSGGRYIVPVDWITLFYFVLGFFQLFTWKVPNTENRQLAFILQKDSHSEGKSVTLALILVLAMGSSLIIPDFIFRQKIKPQSIDELSTLVRLSVPKDKYDYLVELLETEEIFITTGQILYPRYYLAEDGELSYFYPYKTLDYSRLAFLLIGPRGTSNAIMPGAMPENLANLSEAIVIGCPQQDGNEKYIDVGIILIKSDKERIYFREPLLDENCESPKSNTSQ